MRFGWSPSGSNPPLFPAAASTDWAIAAPAGWTHGLENEDTYNGLGDIYMLPSRGENGSGLSDPSRLGFVTRVQNSSGTSTGSVEKYFYAVEIAPTTSVTDPQVGPRMTPIVDDVDIFYMPWHITQVIQEHAVVYDE